MSANSQLSQATLDALFGFYGYGEIAPIVLAWCTGFAGTTATAENTACSKCKTKWGAFTEAFGCGFDSVGAPAGPSSVAVIGRGWQYNSNHFVQASMGTFPVEAYDVHQYGVSYLPQTYGQPLYTGYLKVPNSAYTIIPVLANNPVSGIPPFQGQLSSSVGDAYATTPQIQLDVSIGAPWGWPPPNFTFPMAPHETGVDLWPDPTQNYGPGVSVWGLPYGSGHLWYYNALILPQA